MIGKMWTIYTSPLIKARSRNRDNKRNPLTIKEKDFLERPIPDKQPEISKET